MVLASPNGVLAQLAALAAAAKEAWVKQAAKVLRAEMTRLHNGKSTGERYYITALGELHTACQELFSNGARAAGWIQDVIGEEGLELIEQAIEGAAEEEEWTKDKLAERALVGNNPLQSACSGTFCLMAAMAGGQLRGVATAQQLRAVHFGMR
jgi:hypothetical protein